MIQPVRRGAALLQEIEAADCPTPNLWWLGQSGFVIKYQGIIFYIDPYLSESLTDKYQQTERPHIRMTECPLDPSTITHADLVLCTHKHSDHLDPRTVSAILEASARAKLVLPKSLTEHAHSIGIPYHRMTTTDSDLRVEYFKDGHYGRVYAIPSAHEQLDWTSPGGYPYLGYLIRFGPWTIYHAGDCVPYEGLAERLKPYRVSLALLPINGRDPKRGVPGNFEIPEAAQLAEDIGAEWLAPMHYDMFTFNTVDVNRFIEHMLGSRPAQRFKVFECGERWALPND
jgi:L-ascorbate metabolism protein UlaG (beta-lactamase superfamily)